MPSLLKKKVNPKKQDGNDDNKSTSIEASMPSERDRKALLGCLVGVFGLIRSSKQSCHSGQSNLNSRGNPSSRSGSKNLLEKEEDADPFSIIFKFCTNLLMLKDEYASCYYPIYANEEENTDYKEVLSSFMNMFSSYEDAFGCLSLLMFQFLLHSSPEERREEGLQLSTVKMTKDNSIVGYDARVRRVFQCLAVEIFQSFLPEANASIQFLALEEFLSKELLNLYQLQQQSTSNQSDKATSETSNRGMTASDDINNKNPNRRKMVMRGLKIGGAGVVAGTLLAVTGGMAAPALAAGIAAVAGGTIIATTASILLTSSYAVITIFGVGGGLHVASKMSKRTSGLTDFSIHYSQEKRNKLVRTIGISGWVRPDISNNFQHPWGYLNRLERLQNFLLLHSPDNVSKAEDMLYEWQDKEDDLWSLLQSEYGTHPGPKPDPILPLKEKNIFYQLRKALGYPPIDDDHVDNDKSDHELIDDQRFQRILNISSTSNGENNIQKKDENSKKKKFAMWDFHSEYFGELYTIQWEQELLSNISRATEALVQELASKAATEAMKKTVMASVIAAVALPLGIVKAADMIDSPWTLICERADEAGVELARILLQTTDGHRPVNLVGYSMGARIILSCLKELNRHQIIYMEQQNGNGTKGQKNKNTPLQKLKNSVNKSVRKSASTESLKSDSSNTSNHQQQPEEEDGIVSYQREPASIIQDVVIMGCPATVPKNMAEIRNNVVAGRMINCYHPKDWTLLAIYRYKQKASLLGTLIGTNKIDCMENRNVSSLLEWHSQYGIVVRDILSHVQFQHPNLHHKEREDEDDDEAVNQPSS